MKDESKAKWPEEMWNECSDQGQHRVWVGSAVCVASLHNEDMYDVTEQEYDEAAEYRAKQICALPSMVALLKEMAQWKDVYARDLAMDILAQIGEVE